MIKQDLPSKVRRLIFSPGVIFVALFVAASPHHAFSQQVPNSSVVSGPSVSFTLDFPNSEPAHYAITVDATGHASYDCIVKVEGADDQTYKTEFNLTPSARQHIFDWAKQAKYFTGKIDSENRKLAFTGDKALSYQDGQHSNTAHYNYSNLEPVRELTALFQSMAATLDYGRRLSYDHRYQKLALDDEIRRMEAQAKNNELSEIQGVAPILQEIADDNSVINGVRARARELIQMGAAGH